MIEYLNFYIDGENIANLYICTSGYVKTRFSFGTMKNINLKSLWVMLKVEYPDKGNHDESYVELKPSFLKLKQESKDYETYSRALGQFIQRLMILGNNFEIEQCFDEEINEFLKKYFEERS